MEGQALLWEFFIFKLYRFLPQRKCLLLYLTYRIPSFLFSVCFLKTWHCVCVILKVLVIWKGRNYILSELTAIFRPGGCSVIPSQVCLLYPPWQRTEILMVLFWNKYTCIFRNKYAYKWIYTWKQRYCPRLGETVYNSSNWSLNYQLICLFAEEKTRNVNLVFTVRLNFHRITAHPSFKVN